MVSRESAEARVGCAGAGISEEARDRSQRGGKLADWFCAGELGCVPELGDGSRLSTPPKLLQSGLVKPRDEIIPKGEVYDRFRGRIMFPICNDVGEVIAFSGRVLKDESGSGEISELAGDAALSERQCPLWSAQDEAGVDRGEPAPLCAKANSI